MYNEVDKLNFVHRFEINLWYLFWVTYFLCSTVPPNFVLCLVTIFKRILIPTQVHMVFIGTTLKLDSNCPINMAFIEKIISTTIDIIQKVWNIHRCLRWILDKLVTRFVKSSNRLISFVKFCWFLLKFKRKWKETSKKFAIAIYTLMLRRIYQTIVVRFLKCSFFSKKASFLPKLLLHENSNIQWNNPINIMGFFFDVQNHFSIFLFCAVNLYPVHSTWFKCMSNRLRMSDLNDKPFEITMVRLEFK